MNKLVLQIYASIICAISILFLAIYLYSMTLATISLILPKYFNVVNIDKFSNDKKILKKLQIIRLNLKKIYLFKILSIRIFRILLNH
jgi:hypothetical protein